MFRTNYNFIIKQMNYVQQSLKPVTNYVNKVGVEIAKQRLCHKCWRKYLKEVRQNKLINLKK